MIPRVMVGLLSGAMAAAIALAILRHARPAGMPGGAATGAARHTDAAAAAPAEDLASLRAEVAALEASGKQLREDERRLSGSLPPTASAKMAADRRAAVAARVARILAEIGKPATLLTPEGQFLTVDFQRWIDSLCEETGLPRREVTFSPQGLWTFVLEAMDAAGEPLSGEERRIYEAEFAKAREAWDAYMVTRPNLTPMERDRETFDLMQGFLQAIDSAFVGERQERAQGSFSYFNLSLPGNKVHDISAPQGDVRNDLIEGWASDLALDPGQTAVLGPIVDEYMARYLSEMTALKDDVRARNRMSYDLMIAAQKRIAAELELSADQSGRLKNWSTRYLFELQK